MKRLIMITCILTACCTVARPGPFRPAPPPRHFHHLPHSYHHYYHTYVSPLTVFTVGTFVGAVIANTDSKTIVVQQPTVIQRPVVTVPIVQQPTVIQRPVVTVPIVQQPVQVWVPGHYEDQLQANGTKICIWVPGHYEVR